MIRVDFRGWVDLERVIVFVGVFKQAVHRVEHLVGELEEPLSAKGNWY